MSLITYILESCDGNLKYRVNFTGATYLDVGETWNVECNGIPNGCYNVLENTSEVLDEYNGDECLFVEFENCEDCESSVDNVMAGPTGEPCYRWDRCDGTVSPIYIPTAYDNYDFIEYNSNCYENSYVVSTTNPTTTSVGSTQWRTDCETCTLYLGVSEVECHYYTPCPDDPRSFETLNAYAFYPSEANYILYPTSAIGAGSDVIYFRNTETGQQKCFYLTTAPLKERRPTQNVERIDDYTSAGASVDACVQCQLACDAQDIIIYFDNRAFTTTQGEPRFEAMKQGILNYLESIEDDIVNDSIRVGIYRKNTSCSGGDGQVLALNDTYNTIVNAVTNMSFNSFDLDEYSVYQDMYDELTGVNSREFATAKIIWLTDTFFTSYGQYCWTGPQPSPVKANFLTLAKMGWVNGIGGKQVMVQVVEDIVPPGNNYVNWYGGESVATTTNDYIATTWTDFSATTTGSWTGITDITCEDFVSPGDGFNTYQALPCCSGPVIYVTIDSGFTPTIGTQTTSDGFEYGGICYWLKAQVSSETYSGQTVGVIYSGDIVNTICTDTITCNCSKVYVRTFENCCDSSDTITIAYSEEVAGNPASTDGFISNDGECYVWDGSGTVSTTISDYWADEWVTNICIDGSCPTCPSNTPTPTPTISVTPTITVTPTPSPTPPFVLSEVWSGCTTGNLYKLYDTSTNSNVEGIVGGTSGFTTTGRSMVSL
jgi:hypothetical protein